MKKRLVGLLPIIAIVILASYLRIKGFNPGYPPYHSDEGIGYSAALEMLNNKMDPGRYDYPALVPLINALAFKFILIPIYWLKFYILNFNHILDGFIKIPLSTQDSQRIYQLEILGERELNALAWSRLITAIFGVGTVVMLYVTAKKMFSKRVGLLAALFLAVNYRHVLNSHFGLPDIYNAFFLMTALYFAYLVYKQPNKKHYVLAAIASGLSLAVKYQFFSFFPLAFAHLLVTTKNKKIKKYQLVTPFIILLIFLVINPYLFIKFEETREWLWLVKTKYATGINRLDFYGYSYLYHVGIGKLTSLLVCLGIIFSFKKKTESVFLLSIILPFFYITTYFTGASFYTRNFVTIIPILLIFAAIFIDWILDLRKFGLAIGVFLIIFSVKESFLNSIVVAQQYSKKWNYELVSDWVSQNIPENSVVAAHSSVPLPIKGVSRIPLDLEHTFSLEEARDKDADFVVVNLDWATENFYWWMRQDTKNSLKYWNKPVLIMQQSHSAMAIHEILQQTIYEQTNPWQAPESDFIVAKIPKIDFQKQDLLKSYDFKNGTEGWQTNTDSGLELTANGLTIAGGSGPFVRWESPEIAIDNAQGFLLDYARTAEFKRDNVEDGFVGVLGFDPHHNSTFVRFGERWSPDSVPQGSLVGKISPDTKYVRIIFQVYDPANVIVSLSAVKLFAADVDYDYGEFKPFNFKLDDDILFPYSHGGL